MWRDPIIEKLHEIRLEHARKFNFNLRALFNDLKEQEKKSRREIVSLPIKREMIKQPKPVVVH